MSRNKSDGRMQRLSVQLPVEVYDAAMSEAKAAGVSISCVIRWALKDRFTAQLNQVCGQMATPLQQG